MIHHGLAFWTVVAAGLAAPTGVTASRNGLDVEVDWTHDGAGATGFRIYRRSRVPAGSFGSYALHTTVTPETDTDHTDATAVGELEYQYRVHAWDGVTEGPGAESNVVASVAAILWQPGEPSDLIADDVSVYWQFQPVLDYSGLQVWWRDGAPLGADPSATGILAYEGTTVFGNLNTGSTDNLVYLAARARYGSPGSYRYGPWSEERSVTSRPRVPGVPTGVTFTKTGTTTGELAWSPGSPDTATVYDIQVASRAVGSGTWSAWSNAIPSTDTASPYTFDEVLEGNEYKLRVRGRNTGGSSAYVESNAVAFADPPAAPSGVSAVVDATYPGHFIDVSWTDNSDDETGFVVERALDSGGSPGAWSDLATVGAGVTAYEDQSAGAPIGAPTISAVDTIDDDQVQVTVSGLPSNADGWEVYYVASALDFQVDDTGVSVKVVGSGLSTTITGLAADTVHQLRVCATNSAGRGVPSARSTVTTGPTAPKNLQAVVNGGNHDLTWEIGSRDEDLILVERKIGAGAYSQVASRPAGSTSYSLTAVASSTYRVRFSGEGTYSNEATP